jgi:hypothetical protein
MEKPQSRTYVIFLESPKTFEPDESENSALVKFEGDTLSFRSFYPWAVFYSMYGDLFVEDPDDLPETHAGFRIDYGDRKFRIFALKPRALDGFWWAVFNLRHHRVGSVRVDLGSIRIEWSLTRVEKIADSEDTRA